MKVTVHPGPCQGSLAIPPSKSLTHRYLIAAALSGKASTINDIYLSKDVLSTLDVLSKLNIEFQVKGADLLIEGQKPTLGDDNNFFIKESAATLRFVLPLLSSFGQEINIELGPRLALRPLNTYRKIWKKQKLSWKLKKNILTINGKLKPGTFNIKENISSQFISGLLFYLPLLDGDSIITLPKKYGSYSYIRLTLQVLAEFGIKIDDSQNNRLIIPGNQAYSLPDDFSIDADYSQAANFLGLAAINSPLSFDNLPILTLQGDAMILDILKNKQVQMSSEQKTLIVKPGVLSGSTIDFDDCPDLAPIACVLAALSSEKTVFLNTKRLKYKESDRLQVMQKELKKLGIKIHCKTNAAVVFPWNRKMKKSIELDCHNDHRILMALVILATVLPKALTINDAQCVEKSYPTFYQDLERLGVQLSFDH